VYIFADSFFLFFFSLFLLDYYVVYSLLKFLRIKPYNHYPTFKSEISGNHGDKIENDKSMSKLRFILQATTLRRTKSTLVNGKPLLSLPNKTIETQKLNMTNEERLFYEKLEKHMRNNFGNLYNKTGDDSSIFVKSLVLLLRLRQGKRY